SFDIFAASADINGDYGQCSILHKRKTIQVSKPQSFTTTRRDIVNRFFASGSEYAKEFAYFFKENPISDQVKHNTVDQYWYRLAGSLVYLEQYGVHFMVSRMVYSYDKRRDKPALSLVYGQIFDENWKELPNVELVVPSNNPDIHNDEKEEAQKFTAISYPDFLPFPAYHKFNINKDGYYGPEDPRIIVVKNPKGYEEPLVLFNANHRKILEEEIEEASKSKVLFKEYRSMFMSWPWQFQRGKLNMEDLKSKHNSNLYTRVIELKIENSMRLLAQQKNWTPFISFQERVAEGYDKYIYMVIRWNNIEVLKCSLTENFDNSVSSCSFEYKMRTTEVLDGVGPLRGGTEMVNVNMLLHEHVEKFPQLQHELDRIPEGREVYLGFARAHFKECGCGKGFYRPNLVTLVKDNASQYKLHDVGSFMSLNVPVTSWDLSRDLEECINGLPNLLIPNGVSAWDIRKVGTHVLDYLTLSFSVNDHTVDMVHIQGLLRYLLPGLNENGHFGYDNDNVKCAMDLSSAYCTAYGE
ncbi:glycosyltransferase family 91 protein, partial [Suhomyces tanzawaensis NRRL Y-17324]